MKTKVYWTLALWCEGRWTPQFGDYDRTLVVAEMEDMRDHETKSSDMKIVASLASQAEIKRALAALPVRS